MATKSSQLIIQKVSSAVRKNEAESEAGVSEGAVLQF